MYCDPILITWWHYCCCQTKLDGSRHCENLDTIEPESHQGLSRPDQNLGRNVHGSPSYVNLPEQPPHIHTEQEDKYGYLQSVCVRDNEHTRSGQHENVNPTEPESHSGQPRPHLEAAVDVDDSLPYVNMPQEHSHSHSALTDIDGYSRAVCNHDNERKVTWRICNRAMT